jgi:hypothetical protein
MEKDFFKKAMEQHKLPKLEEIEEAFEISVKNDSLVIQNIRNEISFKAYEIAKSIESLIFINEGTDPDVLYTEQMIRDQKESLYLIYKELNSITMKGSSLRFEHDRKKDAEFIKSALKEWTAVESLLKTVFAKAEEGWKNLSLESNNIEETYHG